MVAKEKDPAALFSFKAGDEVSVSRLFEFEADKYFLRDISDIFCKEDGGVLILSDESALVAESSAHGELLSFLELDAGFNGLESRVPQAEGIGMDEEQNLYIVSEPNILYIYRSPVP